MPRSRARLIALAWFTFTALLAGVWFASESRVLGGSITDTTSVTVVRGLFVVSHVNAARLFAGLPPVPPTDLVSYDGVFPDHGFTCTRWRPTWFWNGPHSWELTVPLWQMFAGLGALGVTTGMRCRSWRRANACSKCGYSRVGLGATKACPECGTAPQECRTLHL